MGGSGEHTSRVVSVGLSVGLVVEDERSIGEGVGLLEDERSMGEGVGSPSVA